MKTIKTYREYVLGCISMETESYNLIHQHILFSNFKNLRFCKVLKWKVFRMEKIKMYPLLKNAFSIHQNSQKHPNTLKLFKESKTLKEQDFRVCIPITSAKPIRPHQGI